MHINWLFFIVLFYNNNKIPNLKEVIISSIFLVLSVFTFAQSTDAKVSLIGDDEKSYESVISECPSLLLQVTNNSMDKAYQHWTSMLIDMETSAADSGLDLKGAKLWINLFWEADGSIKNIVYYPKPNSKNMDFDVVTAFLENFAADYHMPVSHTECFSHYGSASFPVHRTLAMKNEK